MKSFLNQPVRKMTNPLFPGKPSSRKRLPAFGDFDMDGSPNKFDCNPFRMDKDAKNVETNEEDFNKAMQEFKSTGEKGISEMRGRTRLRQQVKAVQERRGRIASQVSMGASRLASQRYTKQSRRAQGRVAGRTLGLVRLLTPAGTVPSAASSKNKGRRGRPAGPSGRYFIPGVGPVGVYQYRAWLANQRRLRSLRGDESVQQMQTQAKQVYMPEGIPAEQAAYAQEVPAYQFNQIRGQDIPRQPKLIRPSGTGNLVQQQEIQLQMQQADNILLAPQFMKGQLTNTGADILSDKGRPNILQAPNAFLGQLRNLQARNPVELGEKPITNPYGDYFTTIDPITGNAIIQRRVKEKWLTGEAL